MPLLYPRAIIRYQIVPLNGFIRNVIKLDMIMCQTKLNIQDLGIIRLYTNRNILIYISYNVNRPKNMKTSHIRFYILSIKDHITV